MDIVILYFKFVAHNIFSELHNFSQGSSVSSFLYIAPILILAGIILYHYIRIYKRKSPIHKKDLATSILKTTGIAFIGGIVYGLVVGSLESGEGKIIIAVAPILFTFWGFVLSFVAALVAYFLTPKY